jgi:hypothetical protein
MIESEPRSGLVALAGLLRRRSALVAVVGVATVLRFHELGRWWLNPDEGIYFSLVTRETFAGFWAEVTANAHPPLYYLLLRALGHVTWDFVALRASSALFGVVAVVAVWAAARELALAMPPPRRTDRIGAIDAGSDDSAVADPRRAEWAGLAAATILAVAPGAVLLSQLMRPYMLQVALLAGALTFLLRYRSDPTARSLAAYVALAILALLTHYSSVLAVGAFGALVAFDGVNGGTRRRSWRRLAACHVLPAAIVGWLYLGHVRTLAGTDLADLALNGWLGQHMIDSVADARRKILGYHTIIAIEWMRGPLLVMLAAVPFLAIVRRQGAPAVLALSAIAIGVAGAAMHVYPVGATRHSAWLMALTIPAIGWLVPAAATLPGRAGRAGAVALVGLCALGGPVGAVIGDDWPPWAPNEKLLERDDMLRMLDVVDPEAGPELIVLSGQAFYLFLPFYPHERETAVPSPDGTVFTFEYGDRNVLVSSAWDLKADSATEDPNHLAHVIEVADEAFPRLRISERSTASLVLGGWIPPLLQELGSPPLPERVIRGARFVPSLVALELDLHAIRRVGPLTGAIRAGGDLIPRPRPGTSGPESPPVRCRPAPVR